MQSSVIGKFNETDIFIHGSITIKYLVEAAIFPTPSFISVLKNVDVILGMNSALKKLVCTIYSLKI